MGLARLNRWPDLNEVPDEIIMPVARISALLWNKPTATHLINRLLAGQSDETFRALRSLQSLGYIEFISAEGGMNSRDQADDSKDLSDDIEASSQGKNGFSSFLGKLRQKLLG